MGERGEGLIGGSKGTRRTSISDHDIQLACRLLDDCRNGLGIFHRARLELDDVQVWRLLCERTERIRLVDVANAGKDNRVGSLDERGDEAKADSASGAGDCEPTRCQPGCSGVGVRRGYVPRYTVCETEVDILLEYVVEG